MRDINNVVEQAQLHNKGHAIKGLVVFDSLDVSSSGHNMKIWPNIFTVVPLTGRLTDGHTKIVEN